LILTHFGNLGEYTILEPKVEVIGKESITSEGIETLLVINEHLIINEFTLVALGVIFDKKDLSVVPPP
jgi:hypothetical protein